MAKYLYRNCPRCKDYLGVVVPEPPEPVKVIPIDAYCVKCGFVLNWKIIVGKQARSKLSVLASCGGKVVRLRAVLLQQLLDTGSQLLEGKWLSHKIVKSNS